MTTLKKWPCDHRAGSDDMKASEPMYSGTFVELHDACIMHPKSAAIEIANLTKEIKRLKSQIESGESK